MQHLFFMSASSSSTYNTCKAQCMQGARMASDGAGSLLVTDDVAQTGTECKELCFLHRWAALQSSAR